MASGNDLFIDGFIEIQFTDIQFTHLSTDAPFVMKFYYVIIYISVVQILLELCFHIFALIVDV